PRQFNYSLLTYCEMVDFQGQRVPELLFVSGENRAHVYILTDKEFDLSALPPRPDPASGYDLAVEHPDGNPHVAYLILYTGGSLDLFQRGRREGKVLGEDTVHTARMAFTPGLRSFILPA